jgi:hypothetical protein
MPSLRRTIACILMVWYLPGCSTYRITRTTPQQAVQGEERVILTVQDGSGVRTLYRQYRRELVRHRRHGPRAWMAVSGR